MQVAGLDPPEIELLQKMREMRCSFLLASFDDPDAKIIAASEDFCTQTGYPVSLSLQTASFFRHAFSQQKSARSPAETRARARKEKLVSSL